MNRLSGIINHIASCVFLAYFAIFVSIAFMTILYIAIGLVETLVPRDYSSTLLADLRGLLISPVYALGAGLDGLTQNYGAGPIWSLATAFITASALLLSNSQNRRHREYLDVRADERADKAFARQKEMFEAEQAEVTARFQTQQADNRLMLERQADKTRQQLQLQIDEAAQRSVKEHENSLAQLDYKHHQALEIVRQGAREELEREIRRREAESEDLLRSRAEKDHSDRESFLSFALPFIEHFSEQATLRQLAPIERKKIGGKICYRSNWPYQKHQKNITGPVDVCNPLSNKSVFFTFLLFQLIGASAILSTSRWNRVVSEDHSKFIHFINRRFIEIVTSKEVAGAEVMNAMDFLHVQNAMICRDSRTDLLSVLTWEQFLDSVDVDKGDGRYDFLPNEFGSDRRLSSICRATSNFYRGIFMSKLEKDSYEKGTKFIPFHHQVHLTGDLKNTWFESCQLTENWAHDDEVDRLNVDSVDKLENSSASTESNLFFLENEDFMKELALIFSGEADRDESEDDEDVSQENSKSKRQSSNKIPNSLFKPHIYQTETSVRLCVIFYYINLLFKYNNDVSSFSMFSDWENMFKIKNNLRNYLQFDQYNKNINKWYFLSPDDNKELH